MAVLNLKTPAFVGVKMNEMMDLIKLVDSCYYDGFEHKGRLSENESNDDENQSGANDGNDESNVDNPNEDNDNNVDEEQEERVAGDEQKDETMDEEGNDGSHNDGNNDDENDKGKDGDDKKDDDEKNNEEKDDEKKDKEKEVEEDEDDDDDEEEEEEEEEEDDGDEEDGVGSYQSSDKDDSDSGDRSDKSSEEEESNDGDGSDKSSEEEASDDEEKARRKKLEEIGLAVDTSVEEDESKDEGDVQKSNDDEKLNVEESLEGQDNVKDGPPLRRSRRKRGTVIKINKAKGSIVATTHQITSLDRYRNPKPPVTIFPPLDDKHRINFVAMMRSTFGILTRRINLRQKETKEFINLLKKMFVLKNEKDNIFDFKFSKSADKLIDDEGGLPECPFKLSLEDIESLQHDSSINENVMNFVFQCFNLYKAYEDGFKGSVPTTFFGEVSDKNKVYVKSDSDIYSSLYHHINHQYDPTQNSEFLSDDEVDIPKDLKLWYANDFKGQLTDVLDFYRKHEGTLKEYVIPTVVAETYCVMKVDLSETVEDEKNRFEIFLPTTKDEGHETEEYHNEVNKMATLYSKFFGLYLKESRGIELNDEDFSGIDLRGSSVSETLLQLAYSDKCTTSPEGYDSGIICLDICLDLIKNHHIKDNDMKVSPKVPGDLLNLRLSILNLVMELFNMFYGHHYKIINDHVRLLYGRLKVPIDVKFFKDIHQIFDDGGLQLDIKKKKHANAYFKEYRNNKDTFFGLFKNNKNNKDDKKQQKKKETTYADDNRAEGFLNDCLRIHQVAREHDEKNRIFDVTNKKCFLWHEECKKHQNPHQNSKVRYPDQFVREIYELFMSNFDTSTVEKRNKVFALITASMRMYEVHFVMDVLKSDPKQYQIMAAMIIDPLKEIRENEEAEYEKYCVIHCIASKKGFKKMYFYEKLLDNLMYWKNLNKRNFFWVDNLGGNEYIDKETLEKYMTEYHFKQSGVFFNMVEDKYLQPGSTTKFAMGPDLFEDLGKTKKKKKSLRFMCMRSQSFLFYRLNGNKFELYCHPYGWNQITKNTQEYLSTTAKRICLTKPLVKFKLKISGHRNASDQSKVLEEYKIRPMKEKFLQKTYREQYGADNNCAWLSVAAIIDTVDSDAADRMIKIMLDDLTDFNWMYLSRIPSKVKEENPDEIYTNIVSEKLKKGIGFKLNKISGYDVTNKGFLEFIFNQTEGFYLTGLEAGTGQMSHCIAIDCENRFIYDCMEDYVLAFNENTLNLCVGEDGDGVQGLNLCYKLSEEMKKKPSSSKKKKKKKSNRKRKRETEDDLNVKKKAK